MGASPLAVEDGSETRGPPHAHGPKRLSGIDVARGATAMVSTRVVGALLALGLEVLLVRWLAPGDWDAMARFLTLGALLAIAQLGLPESIVFASARTGSARTAVRLGVRTSVVLAVAGVALSAAVAFVPVLRRNLLGVDDVVLRLALLPYATAELGQSVVPSVLLACRRPRTAALVSLLVRVPPAMGVLAALVLGGGLPAVLWAVSLGAFVSFVLGWALTAASLRAVLAGEPASVRVGWRDQLAFALPIGLSRLVGIVNARVDNYVVMLVLAGQAAYGTYYLGATELALPGWIATAVTSILAPDFVALAGTDRTALLRSWHRSIEKTALVVLPIFLFVELHAPTLFEAMYGPEHVGAAEQYRVWQLLLPWRVTVWGSIALALGLPRVPLVTVLLALLINGVLSYPLALAWGATGASVASVVGGYVASVYILARLRRALGVAWEQLLPWRGLGRIVPVAAAALLPTLLPLALPLPAPARLSICILAYIPSFLALGARTGLLGAEDRAFVRGLWRLEFLRPSSGD